MQIIRLTDIDDRPAVMPALDAIFFEASGTRSFADAAARAAFRHRWLGRYLDAWPELTFLAVDADGTLAGYLAGCTINPATDARFADIGYFETFATACADFPAHLHINLAPRQRGRGLGGHLIDAFADAARDAGAPGMHIVTSKDARNVGFYRSRGFDTVAETVWGAGTVVFMGRKLSHILFMPGTNVDGGS